MSKAKNSVVLYWAYEKHHTTPSAQIIDVNADFVGYLRVEVHLGKDLTEALDAAKPMKGEVVLNSVKLK